MSDYWEKNRIAAAEALGKLGDGRAVEPLVKALGDRDKEVRKAVAKVLVDIALSKPSHIGDLWGEIKGIIETPHGDWHTDRSTDCSNDGHSDSGIGGKFPARPADADF